MEYLKFTLPLWTLKIKVLSNQQWQKMLFSEHSWKCPKGGLSTHQRQFSTIYKSNMHFSSSNHIDRFHRSLYECNTTKFTTALYHTPNTGACLGKQEALGSLQAGRKILVFLFAQTREHFKETAIHWANHQSGQWSVPQPIIFYAAAKQLHKIQDLIQVVHTCRNVPVSLSLGINNCI